MLKIVYFGDHSQQQGVGSSAFGFGRRPSTGRASSGLRSRAAADRKENMPAASGSHHHSRDAEVASYFFS